MVAASGDGTLVVEARWRLGGRLGGGGGPLEARWRHAGGRPSLRNAVFTLCEGRRASPPAGAAGARRAVAPPGAAAQGPRGGPVKGKGKVEQAAAAEVRKSSGLHRGRGPCLLGRPADMLTARRLKQQSREDGVAG